MLWYGGGRGGGSDGIWRTWTTRRERNQITVSRFCQPTGAKDVADAVAKLVGDRASPRTRVAPTPGPFGPGRMLQQLCATMGRCTMNLKPF